MPFSHDWPRLFTREAEVARSVFGSNDLDIQHIGSTSVPGMAGKPLIDLLVIVQNARVAAAHAPQMVEGGYTNYGDYLGKGSHLFVREENGQRLVNLHVFPIGHEHIREMLGLRDYLRRHPEEVTAYSNLKLSVYREHPTDYTTYRKLKDAYVDKLMERVEAWLAEDPYVLASETRTSRNA